MRLLRCGPASPAKPLSLAAALHFPPQGPRAHCFTRGRGAQILPPWPPRDPPYQSQNCQGLLGPGGQSRATLPCAINSAPRPVTFVAQCVPPRSSPQAAPATAAARPGSSRPRLSPPRGGLGRQPAPTTCAPGSTDGPIRIGPPPGPTPAPGRSARSPDPGSAPEHSGTLETIGSETVMLLL
ncbi:hypothetical protein NDU88_007666 [Pleurodeles waltl]|uniref:Uncharacterized protein n=1 Tax=Pleurodeles waltl TaxID=8319 RepID=A0AAV7PQN0_PLEWA|nr:hypothetical protein NDU88_007666 [Pleurodeles waltl]